MVVRQKNPREFKLNCTSGDLFCVGLELSAFSAAATIPQGFQKNQERPKVGTEFQDKVS
jgi:hypothetical protein